MFDTLVDGEDGQIAGVRESSRSEHRAQAREDPGRPVGLGDTAVDEVWTRKVQARCGDCLTLMIEQCGVVTQDAHNSIYPGHTQPCRHSVTSAPKGPVRDEPLAGARRVAVATPDAWLKCMCIKVLRRFWRAHTGVAASQNDNFPSPGAKLQVYRDQSVARWSSGRYRPNVHRRRGISGMVGALNSFGSHMFMKSAWVGPPNGTAPCWMSNPCRSSIFGATP